MQYMQNYTPAEKEERAREREEREAAMRLKNNRLGLTVFQGSWILVFLCLVMINWQMGFSPGWRPEGLQKPDLLLPTIATLALLASTVLARMGWKAVEANQVKQFLSRWLMSIGLGVVFLVIMLQQFMVMVPEGDAELFAQMYRLMIGYHAIHAVVIGIMMIQVYRFGLAGRYHADNTWSVEATTKLWYFVTVAWLLFYVVLYLIP